MAGEIFISYRRADEPWARLLYAQLKDQGVEAWYDAHVGAGEDWRAATAKALQTSRIFVLLFSTAAAQSEDIAKELAAATFSKKLVVPVRIENIQPSGAFLYELASRNWVNAFDNTETKLAELAQSLAKLVKAGIADESIIPFDRNAGAKPAAQKPVWLARKRLIMAAAAAMILLAGGAAVLRMRPAANAASAAHETAGSTAPAPRTAVAVLPFVNLTGDASKEYLGDGMADELINTLGKVEGLKVPARTSSFAYKGRNVNIRDIAKDLQVGTILEGSVRAAGKRIRITAQLINAQDGLRLWSESYDEEFTDIFKLQDKLASEIVGALRPSLHNAAEPVAYIAPTQDVEAYQLYLQGVRLKEVPSKQSYTQALELFAKAVARDPRFARAYGEMAEAHFALFQYGQPQEHLAEAEKLARKALTFGQETRALDALAAVSLTRGHWLEMEGHDQLALASESTNAITLLHRAYHLAAAGKLQAAVEASRKAYEIAPADPSVIGGLAEHLAPFGEDEEAGKFAELALQTGLTGDNPGWVDVHARAARKAGQYAKAADVSIDYLDFMNAGDAGARSKEVVRLVHAALADPKQRAAALAARARLYPPNRRVSASANTNAALYFCFASAQMYVLLDAIDDAYSLAFQCLDEQPPSGATPGAAVHRPFLSIWSPEMRPFRRDPRFQAIVTRIGLMEYWKQYGPPDDCDLKNGKLTCR